MDVKNFSLKSHFAAVYMVVFLIVCFVIACITAVTQYSNIFPEDKRFKTILNGQWAANVEKAFEDHLIIRDYVVDFWGAVKYGVFKSGAKEVIVGRDGWLFTTEEFQQNDRANEAETRLINIVIQTDKFLKQYTIELVVVLVPSKARIYSEFLGHSYLPLYRQTLYSRLQKAFSKQGIISPDFVSILDQKKDIAPLYLKQDTHWTPQGAKVIAEALAERLEDLDFERSIYTIKEDSPQGIDGDLEKYIPTGVFKSWFGPQQEFIVPTSIKKSDSEANVSGLFGNESIPIALVGTSYSAIKKWNFEGSLKYALQADVLNVALEGKGPLEPMAEFLKNTDFNNTDIKVVIWEIPERFVPVSYDDVRFPVNIEAEH